MPVRSRSALSALALLAVAALPACSTPSLREKSLTPTVAATPQPLRDCRALTVTPFALPADGKVDAEAGRILARDITIRARGDYGPLFESVEYAEAPRGLAGECVLGGDITKLKKGSKVARFVLIGLGPASFEGRIVVTDAAGTTLLEAPFDRLWAWGGVAGAAYGVDAMKEEVGAAIAATLARAKGWTPPPKKHR